MAFYSSIPTGDFGSLFRLLDDYDTHRASTSATGRGPRHASTVRSFTPKFDVREHKDGYELIGELPGVDQKDIHIEFSDSSTLTVKGHVERSDSYGSDGKVSGRITEQQEYKKPTAEDEDGDKQKDAGNNNQEVTKHDEGAKQQPKYKYWVAERSVGEFHRSFTFPTRVDTDNVKAGFKDGILTITVKKAAEPQAKRINIE